MKMFVKLVLCICLGIGVMFSSTGCSPVAQQYTLNLAELSVNTADFQGYYKLISAAVRAKQESTHVFAPEEWVKIERFDTLVSDFYKRIDGLVKMNIYTFNIVEMKYMLTMIRASYKECYPIVESKWDQFTDLERMQIKTLDNTLVNINTNLDKLVEDPANHNITQTLITVSSIAVLAMKVISVAAAVSV